MTAIYVIGAVLGVLVLLLSCSLTLYVDIAEEIDIRLGIFGLRFRWDKLFHEREQKPKRRKKKPKKQKSSEEKPAPKKTKKKLTDQIHMVLEIVKSVIAPTKYMLRHVRVTRICAKVTIGEEDADETAMTYAAVSTAVYDTLALLKTLIRVKVKQIDIRPDFVTGEWEYEISGKVKIRLFIILFGAVGMISNLIGNTLNTKSKS